MVICALGVGLTEGAVRLFFADELTSVGRVSRFNLVPSKVPGMPYEWAPGLFRFTNNLGMRRVVNATVAKPPGVFRLLVIGDSVADYVTDSNRIEDLFASRLEKELRARTRRPVEVLNFSLPGISLRQELSILRHKGLALAPDAVVIAYCINDPIETDMGDMTNLVSSPLQLVNLFRLRAYRHARDGDWYAAGSPVFQRLDEAFTDLASLARTTPIALAVMPLTEAAAREQPHREPVLSLCARHGVPCLDLFPALAARLPSFGGPPNDNVHFNQAGHDAIAEFLAGALLATIESGRWPPVPAPAPPPEPR